MASAVVRHGHRVMADFESKCPLILHFMYAWRAYLSADDRTRLYLPLEPRFVGTRSTESVEERRRLLVADWLIRVNVPTWLRLAKLDADAATLEALPEITSLAAVPSVRGPLEAARERSAAVRATVSPGYFGVVLPVFKKTTRAVAIPAACDTIKLAGEDPAWDAARKAAGDAIWVAAAAVAREAVRAHPGREAAKEADRRYERERASKDARDAKAAAWFARLAASCFGGAAAKKADIDAYSAALDAKYAARAPITAAARAAALDAFVPTVERLQLSLLDLVSRMIEVRDAGGAGRTTQKP